MNTKAAEANRYSPRQHASAVAGNPFNNAGGAALAQAARGRQCVGRPRLNCRVARMQMLASTPSAPPAWPPHAYAHL